MEDSDFSRERVWTGFTRRARAARAGRFFSIMLPIEVVASWSMCTFGIRKMHLKVPEPVIGVGS